MHQKRPAPAQTTPGFVMVPATKRLQVDAAGVGVGIGGGVAVAVAPAQPSPPGKRQLRPSRPSMLVLFFVAQVKEELKCNRRLRRVIRGENAVSQKRAIEAFDCVFQKAFDNAFQKHLDPIYRSLQSLTNRTDILSHEVEQIKHLNSNHHANGRYRSEANQEYADAVEESNQEQTAATFATREAHEGQAVQLRFLNKLDTLVYTKDKITAQDGSAIKISIFRDNQIVTSGPLSSARIEVLVLHDKFCHSAPDNWTEREFNDHIVSGWTVLGGVCQVKLKNGEASLSDVSFNVPSSKTGSKKLILAARVLSSDKVGLRIKEAVMNPVEVQVNRNKQNKKSERPKLKDGVHRLRGISGKGCRIQWLKDNQINTVEEFLKGVNKDEENICTGFNLNKDNKLWKATVEHAKECDLEGNGKLKSYGVGEQHVVLFFNCVHDLVGAKFHDRYVARDNFSSDEQDAVNCLRKCAYDELDNIEFDHEMKDNYPVSLSATQYISMCDDASIPFTYTTRPNTPDLPVKYQVQGIAEAEIYHAHEPSQALPNNNNGCGQHFLHGYQGNQAGAVNQMGPEYSQEIDALPCYIAQATEGTSYGGNNMIGPANVPQNGNSIVQNLFVPDNNSGAADWDWGDNYAYFSPDNENQNEMPHSSANPGPF